MVFLQKRIAALVGFSLLGGNTLANEANKDAERTIERVSIVGGNVSSLELLGSTSVLSEEELKYLPLTTSGKYQKSRR